MTDESKGEIQVSLTAPIKASFIEFPELAIRFFNSAKLAYADGKKVNYDLSKTKIVTESFVAVLIAHIKDRNINEGVPSTLTFPEDEKCKNKLRKLGVFKHVNDSIDTIPITKVPIHKATNLKVANKIAKSSVTHATNMLYGEEKRISELYSILIEVMANTNNHAEPTSAAVYPWWLFYSFDKTKNIVKYIFLDLGVGLFESLPVKQYIQRNPFNFATFQGNRRKTSRQSELAIIFSQLVEGKIKSSTGSSERGRGIPLIAESALSGHFRDFILISNDGYANLKTNEVSNMNEHFSGTLIYFELQRLEG